jgi:prepilin-type N-terminal cleavage/methylation domain-containing protein
MRRRHGLTIVECMIAMTILSVIVLVTCYTLAAGQQHIYEGNRLATAARLGRDLIEEISARSSRDPSGTTNFGPEPDEMTRAAFDDVDDYKNYSEPAGSLVDATGTPYPAADQVFSRSVSINKAPLNVSDLGGQFNGLTVKVTVQAPTGQQWVFTRFIPEPAQ